MTALDTRETRVRRALKRRGLTLVKSRRRDPNAIGFGAYHIAELYGARVMGVGAHGLELKEAPMRLGGPLRFAMYVSLDRIEAMLSGPLEGTGDASEAHPV